MTKYTTIPLSILTIEDDGFHLALKAKLNGKIARLVVDTGASRTVFDSKRIEKFIKAVKFEENGKLSTGLGTNSMKSHITIINKMQIGDLIIKNYPAILLDLSHVNLSYESIGLKEIDGVLGSDIFKERDAIIDFKKRTIKLRTGA